MRGASFTELREHCAATLSSAPPPRIRSPRSLSTGQARAVVTEGRQADKTVIGAHAPFEGLLDGAPSGTAKARQPGGREPGSEFGRIRADDMVGRDGRRICRR